MSEVKAFTGFIAIDGTTHTSKTAAINHSRTVKIKTALAEKFGNVIVEEEIGDGDIIAQKLDAFIYENREEIIAALNQEVLTRKKRTVKPKIEGAKPAGSLVAAAAAALA